MEKEEGLINTVCIVYVGCPAYACKMYMKSKTLRILLNHNPSIIFYRINYKELEVHL
jgi:hypothetical protein